MCGTSESSSVVESSTERELEFGFFLHAHLLYSILVSKFQTFYPLALDQSTSRGPLQLEKDRTRMGILAKHKHSETPSFFLYRSLALALYTLIISLPNATNTFLAF